LPLDEGPNAEARSSVRAPAAPYPDVDLALHTTLGVGGPARWYMRAETADDVGLAHEWSRERGVPLYILGGGSNLVIADGGVDGLVLHMHIRGVTFQPEGDRTRVAAGAGEPWDPLVAAVVGRGLAGLECLSGIPGTVGGTPIQNVGAYGQDVAETIEGVSVYDRTDGTLRTLTAADCRFGYRMSRFKREDVDRFVVCGVTFLLRTGSPRATYPDIVRHLERAGIDAPALDDVRLAVLDVRRRKGMVLDPADPDTRSVGSFFMNPIVEPAARDQVAAAAGTDPPGYAAGDGRVKIPAAWLIERAGFQRGEADGAVAISGKHTLALVNRGGATARDVLRLALRIKRAVLERFGVWLRPEPVFMGFEADPDVVFLQSQP
jgi:UDP-N-acetylmuramate dehydrogenase